MRNESSIDYSKPVGEIVRGSISNFETQCHQLYETPPVGSLVVSRDVTTTYGIVYEITTKSIDPGRQPVALGKNEDTVEQVYQRNPQLSKLLTTEFRSVVVGHQESSEMRYYLAPSPPRIHSFVYFCDKNTLTEFSQSLDFIQVLISSELVSNDDVISSFIHQASVTQQDQELFLINAGKELAKLLNGQLPRLNSFLRRLSK